MTNSNSQLEHVLGLVEKEKVHFVHLVFMDILGFQKTVVIPAMRLERAVKEGAVFDGSSVVGYATVEESDMRLFPDLDTFLILPWYDENKKTAQVICNIHESSGRHFDGDPRNVLRKIMKKAESKGFIFNTGPEYEYFLFNDAQGKKPELMDKAGYFDLMPMDQSALLNKEIMMSLTSMGIEVETSHHEVAPSQHEVDLKYSDAMTSADRVFVLKYAIKTLATNSGMHATFMPKPLNGVNGSGMHVHQSLLSKDGKNLFYDEGNEDGLSPLCLSFLAGVLEHSRDICSILSSWPNSYKRLVPGFEAPVYVCWAKNNRSALVRVPAGRGMSTRLEMRSPDSAGNPYLQFAVLLGAGLDGVERGLEPPSSVEKDVFKMTQEQRDRLSISSLPSNLGHAINLTSESKLVKNILGNHILEHFIHSKSREWDLYRTNVSSWEVDRYLPVL